MIKTDGPEWKIRNADGTTLESAKVPDPPTPPDGIDYDNICVWQEGWIAGYKAAIKAVKEAK